ncbi:MAG: radical SAM protein [Candidatus Bathyarchaeota archaeon]|nr:radical SAM protein [Candidatus Bathyarchaeota archaeon]
MSETKSICPECQKKIDAQLNTVNGKIQITKQCPDHGEFKATHWQSQPIFDHMSKYDQFQYLGDLKAPKNPEGCPYVCETCKNHASGTVIGVIDVTKRCNLRCAVCFSTFPNQESTDYEPTKQALLDMLEFAAKANPKPPAILFSGGEPCEREDMPEIIAAAHKLKFMTILATNGMKIADDPALAERFKNAGLNIVYLSFDSFHEDFNKKIRGRELLNYKLRTIDVCRKFDMEVILVNTLMKSLNDEEVGDMIRFAAKNTDIVRGLIFQPIAFTGRATENPFRENFREWSFAEDVERQTNGEIKSTDLYPMSVMTSPIKIMRQFMQKPWPLFSCSPQCGIVNWVYVSPHTGKMYPINRFVNFERFFNTIRKTAEHAESKSRVQLLAPLFMGAMISMNMLLVTKEVGTFTLMKSILSMHMDPTYKSLGKIRRRIFLLGCMAFMDSYNFDVNRVRRCVVHYITPDKKIIPFCAYNNVHRVAIEKAYAEKQKQAPAANMASVESQVKPIPLSVPNKKIKKK